MSVIGNPITLGGGGRGTHVCLAVSGRNTSTSLSEIYQIISGAESDYFTINLDGDLFLSATCNKAGTYLVQYLYKPGYNTSGNLINMQLCVQVNESNFVNVTSNTATGAVGSTTVTLAVGDVITLKTRNTSNSTNSHAATVIFTTT